ncbi:hypothetical protein PAPYR_7694 [Paratrimastix pyriformis]|uniref:Uncharacterized protein n=1 Tax=Paratrimastix pyriformis TaxID=342808 RepID=A0ABQ8UDV6_9EUKA|nr:hypothetical protein PAPYR_7694 [Paratrimastix pyriformis]
MKMADEGCHSCGRVLAYFPADILNTLMEKSGNPTIAYLQLLGLCHTTRRTVQGTVREIIFETSETSDFSDQAPTVTMDALTVLIRPCLHLAKLSLVDQKLPIFSPKATVAGSVSWVSKAFAGHPATLTSLRCPAGPLVNVLLQGGHLALLEEIFFVNGDCSRVDHIHPMLPALWRMCPRIRACELDTVALKTVPPGLADRLEEVKLADAVIPVSRSPGPFASHHHPSTTTQPPPPSHHHPATTIQPPPPTHHHPQPPQPPPAAPRRPQPPQPPPATTTTTRFQRCPPTHIPFLSPPHHHQPTHRTGLASIDMAELQTLAPTTAGAFLRRCRNLKRLYLHTEGALPNLAAVAPQLTHLTIHYDFKGPLAAWGLCRLEVLNVFYTNEPDMTAVVSANQSTLRSLTLREPFDDGRSDDGYDDEDQGYDCRFLVEIPLPRLEDLHLALPMTGCPELVSTSLRRLILESRPIRHVACPFLDILQLPDCTAEQLVSLNLSCPRLRVLRAPVQPPRLLRLYAHHRIVAAAEPPGLADLLARMPLLEEVSGYLASSPEDLARVLSMPLITRLALDLGSLPSPVLLRASANLRHLVVTHRRRDMRVEAPGLRTFLLKAPNDETSARESHLALRCPRLVGLILRAGVRLELSEPLPPLRRITACDPQVREELGALFRKARVEPS